LIISPLAAVGEGIAAGPAAAPQSPGYAVNFESIRNCFFIGGSRFLLFHGGMSTVEDGGNETLDWFVERDAAALGAAAASPSARARRDHDRANSLGIVITGSLLFVLFTAALLVGGQAAFGPLLHRGAAAGEAKGMGDVVVALPDGVFCRHMSFDNATSEVIEGAVERCRTDIGERALSPSRFEWGTH
jgi:hypothetical protein